jgi:hypothetical protein
LVVTNLRYYGISPWEIEVAYSYLNSRFDIQQEELEPNDPNFVSVLHMDIPIEFSEEFFQWFDFRRWEKMKALFKEMKRRRGSSKALKITIGFAGKPSIRFVLDAKERQWYDNSIEKIDFVLELLPYHLDPQKLPPNISEIVYRFDEETKRWRLNEAWAESIRFIFNKNSWKKYSMNSDEDDENK